MKMLKYFRRYLEWLFAAPKSPFLDAHPVIIRAMPMFMAMVFLFIALIYFLKWLYEE
jgi:hypothetical protein